MPKRILLIDDESDIREVASASLEIVGEFEVLTADSASAGLVVASREQPDLILLDLMMPEIDGCEALEDLKRNAATRDIPVIFLTAKALKMDEASVRRAGAVGALLKPFDPMLLPGQIRALMGWPMESHDEAST